MKTKITITLPDTLSVEELGAVRYLLCDAFGEFYSNRYPAEKYLAQRYPEGEGYKWLNRAEKLEQVQVRTNLAEKLRNVCAGNGVAVVVEHDPHESGS